MFQVILDICHSANVACGEKSRARAKKATLSNYNLNFISLSFAKNAWGLKQWTIVLELFNFWAQVIIPDITLGQDLGLGVGL